MTFYNSIQLKIIEVASFWDTNTQENVDFTNRKLHFCLKCTKKIFSFLNIVSVPLLFH